MGGLRMSPITPSPGQTELTVPEIWKSRPQLDTYRRQGAPIPTNGPIITQHLLQWLWENRHAVERKAQTDERHHQYIKDRIIFDPEARVKRSDVRKTTRRTARGAAPAQCLPSTLSSSFVDAASKINPSPFITQQPARAVHAEAIAASACAATWTIDQRHDLLPPHTPRTWKDRKTAAAALGLTPRQLGALAGQGAPLPESGRIDSTKLVLWLWTHRSKCPLPEADEERQLRHERMELQNLKLSQRHLDEAQRVVAKRLQRAKTGLAHRLGGPGLADLLEAAHSDNAAHALKTHVLTQFDAAIVEALK